MNYAVKVALAAVAVALVLLSAEGSPTLAGPNVAVTVGGLVIADGGPNDCDGAANGTIEFDSAGAGCAFALPAASSVTLVSGTVKTGGGGALAGLLGGAPSIVNLTDFSARRPGAAGGAGQLTITFSHTFAVPAGPAFAADAIVGTASNPVAAGGTIGAVGVNWQASVNAVNIAPLPVAYVLVVGGVAGPFPFAGSHGLMRVPPPAGPAWTLKGTLKISLAADDQVVLPTSAEVGISGDSVGGIIEPLDEAVAPLEAASSSGPNAGVLAGGVAGAVTAGAVALGGAAWYVRRRRLPR